MDMELLFPFADYWWLWLQDASAEYGLSIEA